MRFCLKRSLAVSWFALTLLLIVPAWSMPASLEGLGLVNHWTDFESSSGELPLDVWGSSDIDGADAVGLWVRFENGLEGSVTYSGVSGHWNSSFGGIAPDTATGFFTGAQLHFLYNNGASLPMAWESLVMPFSNNFDLDYSEYHGSHFRASVFGWESAEFATYSSSVPVTEPGGLFLFTFLFGGLTCLTSGWIARRPVVGSEQLLA